MTGHIALIRHRNLIFNTGTLPVMADIVISELLCFLANYFGKVAKSLLITNVTGFYEENEIVEAKTELFNFVSTLKPGLDDAPRNKQRKSETANAGWMLRTS